MTVDDAHPEKSPGSAARIVNNRDLQAGRNDQCPRCGTPIEGVAAAGPARHHLAPCGCAVDDVPVATFDDRARHLVTDGGTTDDPTEPMSDASTTDDLEWHALTGFKRDILEAIAALQHEGETPYGLGIMNRMEIRFGYPEINHGRLYPNLDELVESGLVRKYEIDSRTNGYKLTTEGRSLLRHHAGQLDEILEDAGARVATDGGLPVPEILDVVDAPANTQCQVLRGGDDPEWCEADAEYLFVYDSRPRDQEPSPSNLLACADCFTPPEEFREDPAVADGGIVVPDSAEHVSATQLETVVRVLATLTDDRKVRYLRARDIAAECDLSSKQVGRSLSAVDGDLHGVAIEKWSTNGRATTWRVERVGGPR